MADLVKALNQTNQQWAQQFGEMRQELETLRPKLTAPEIEEEVADLDPEIQKAVERRVQQVMSRQQGTEDQLDQIKFERYVEQVKPSDEALSLAERIIQQEGKQGRRVTRQSALTHAMGIIVSKGGDPRRPPETQPGGNDDNADTDDDFLERPGRRVAVGGRLDPNTIPTDEEGLKKLAKVIDANGAW